MTLVLATAIGAMFAAGTFLLLRRDLVHVVWGVTILSQAANVYLLAVAGFAPAGADAVPIFEGHGEHAGAAAGETADPLVQALVLTAIVIGFGMTAFALTLTYRVHEEHGTIDATDLGGEP